MLAMAEWLFDQGAGEVAIHPDGMHLKDFDLPALLRRRGFDHAEPAGRTAAGGLWRRRNQTLTVYSRPGRGDVVGAVDGESIEIEAKGGIVNTRHPGQTSRLRKHLYEAVGQLLDTRGDAARLIAAVPRHPVTEAQAARMAPRCRAAGIEIALVDGDGQVETIR